MAQRRPPARWKHPIAAGKGDGDGEESKKVNPNGLPLDGKPFRGGLNHLSGRSPSGGCAIARDRNASSRSMTKNERGILTTRNDPQNRSASANHSLRRSAT